MSCEVKSFHSSKQPQCETGSGNIRPSGGGAGVRGQRSEVLGVEGVVVSQVHSADGTGGVFLSGGDQIRSDQIRSANKHQ